MSHSVTKEFIAALEGANRAQGNTSYELHGIFWVIKRIARHLDRRQELAECIVSVCKKWGTSDLTTGLTGKFATEAIIALKQADAEAAS